MSWSMRNPSVMKYKEEPILSWRNPSCHKVWGGTHLVMKYEDEPHLVMKYEKEPSCHEVWRGTHLVMKYEEEPILSWSMRNPSRHEVWGGTHLVMKYEDEPICHEVWGGIHLVMKEPALSWNMRTNKTKVRDISLCSFVQLLPHISYFLSLLMGEKC